MKKGILIVAVSCFLLSVIHSRSNAQCGHAILAGQTSGLNYSSVNEQLIGTISGDSLVLDLDGDANNDLLFFSEYGVMGNATSSTDRVMILHNKIELFTDTFDPAAMVMGDSISACLHWEEYSGSFLYLAAVVIEPAYLVIGNYVGNIGYMGFRLFSQNDTLYGWVQLYCNATDFYSNMTIIDFAIEDEVTGVENISDAREPKIFPNPASGNVYISAHESSAISVINSSGQVVFKTIATEKQTIVDFSKFAPGVYLYVVSSESGNHTGRIIRAKE